MGRQNQKGLTIIEIMLVITISGLMMMGVFASSSRRVEERQYMEGVRSFRDFIAQQYEDIRNLKNDDSNRAHNVDWTVCKIHNSDSRGTSNCSYTGRVITISNDNSNDHTNLASYPVVTYVEDAYYKESTPVAPGPGVSPVPSTSYIPAFIDSSKIITKGLNVKEIKADWNTVAYLALKNNRKYIDPSFGMIFIMILRDPINGYIKSYAGRLHSDKVSDLTGEVDKLLKDPNPTYTYAGTDYEFSEKPTNFNDNSFYKPHINLKVKIPTKDNVTNKIYDQPAFLSTSNYIIDHDLYICLEDTQGNFSASQQNAIKVAFNATSQNDVTVEVNRPKLGAGLMGNDGSSICQNS